MFTCMGDRSFCYLTSLLGQPSLAFPSWLGPCSELVSVATPTAMEETACSTMHLATSHRTRVDARRSASKRPHLAIIFDALRRARCERSLSLTLV